jgi:hypothetical protein
MHGIGDDMGGSPSPVPLHDLTASMLYEDASVYGEPFAQDAEGSGIHGRGGDHVHVADEAEKVYM